MKEAEETPVERPPRPIRLGNAEVAWGVATLLCADLGWEDFDHPESDGYEGSEKEALVETLADSHDWDGYALARALDDHYSMSVDADTVNQLDVAYVYQSRVYSDLLKKWVKENNLTPKYEVNTRVKVKSRSSEVEEGEIRKVDPLTLTYTIYVESHKGDNTNVKYIGSIYDEEQILDVVS